jgi:glycosyltransferase involved in cell wall biosynthesis
LNHNHLHIISFDIPWPASYGGVIDVFYKIKALSELGWKIHLHCFAYGRQPADLLNNYCEEVIYYERHIYKSRLLKLLPYIVCSRDNELLISNLLKDDFPILMEGLHCTFFIGDERLKHRKKIVRTHNVEHTYYRELANAEQNLFKKFYFNSEALKLEKYEPIVNHAQHIISISEAERKHFAANYSPEATLVSAFHPFEKVTSKTGKGDFVLFHGNLSVAENVAAVNFLLNDVFKESNLKIIIAGNHPSAELKKAVSKNVNFTLIENPDDATMHDLIQNAQVNVLPSFQDTGVKLKIVYSLFAGRHVIITKDTTNNIELLTLCTVCTDAESMLAQTIYLFDQEFSQHDIQKRENVLSHQFSNKKNAEVLSAIIAKLY